MASWSELAQAAPHIAHQGAALIDRSGTGEGMLASVAREGLPRIHPVNVGIVEGRLLVFTIEGSPKTHDLVDDGRFAFHSHVDPARPHELSLRGRVRVVGDAGLRQRALAVWPFDATHGFTLFELDIEHALLGERETARDWPPHYTSWRSARIAATARS